MPWLKSEVCRLKARRARKNVFFIRNGFCVSVNLEQYKGERTGHNVLILRGMLKYRLFL